MSLGLTGRVACWVAVASATACFDSDESVGFDEATGGAPMSTTSTATSDSTSASPASTGEPVPPGTCEDAIDCIVGCVGMLVQQNLPEPDASCVADCAETEELSDLEAKYLIELGNCAGDACAAQGKCPAPDPEPGGSPQLDPCLQCTFTIMRDPAPGEPCQGLADQCRAG